MVRLHHLREQQDGVSNGVGTLQCRLGGLGEHTYCVCSRELGEEVRERSGVVFVVVGVLPPEILYHRTELRAPIMIGGVLDVCKESQSLGSFVVGDAIRDDAADLGMEVLHVGGHLLAEIKAMIDGVGMLGEDVTSVGMDGALFDCVKHFVERPLSSTPL